MNGKSRLLMEILGITRLLPQYRQRVLDFARIKSIVYYVQGIKSVRGLFISFFRVLFCMIFFVAGLVLLHIAAYLFFTARNREGLFLLFLGIVELGGAAATVLWFNSTGHWLREAAKSNPLLEKFIAEHKK